MSIDRFRKINENHRIIVRSELFYNDFFKKVRHYYKTRKLLSVKFNERYFLSVRLTNLFKDNNLITVSDVVYLSHREFTTLIGSGPMTISELLMIIETELYNRTTVYNYELERKVLEDRDYRRHYFNNVVKNIDTSNNNVNLELLLKSSVFKDKFNISYINELKEFDLASLDANDEIFTNFRFIDSFSMLAVPVVDLINIKFSRVIDRIDPDSLDILNRRAHKQTLEQIGGVYNLTRERVRQLESSALKILRADRELFSALHLLKVKIYPKQYITKSDLYEVLKDVTLLFLLIFERSYNKKLEFYYTKPGIKEEVAQEIKKLPFEIDIDEIDDLLESFNFRDLLKKHILENYHFHGRHGFKTLPSLVDLYTPIIKLYFDTINIHSAKDLKKFKQHYADHYEDSSIFEKTNRSITSIFGRLPKVVVVGRGEYKYASAEISDELKEELFKTMQENETLLINGLYVLHEKRLKAEGVTNRFQLHGVITNNIPELYCNRDYVSIKPLGDMNSFQLIKDYIAGINRIFTLKEIQFEIAGLTHAMLQHYIGITNELIPLYHLNFIPVKIIKLTELERTKLREQIVRYLHDNHFITSTGLYVYIFLLFFPQIAKEYDITNPFNAFTFVRYLFPTDFNYLTSTLTLPQDVPLEHEQYIFEEFSRKNPIVLEQIAAYIKKNYLRINNISTLLERFYEIGYIRVDNNRLFHGDALKIDQTFIVKLENVLLRNLYNGKIETKVIENYNIFPRFTVPWNEHLLAHLISNFSDKLIVEKLGNTYRDVTYIIKEKKDG